MDVSRSRPGHEPVNDGQARRAELGVVATYIHQLSERHVNRRSHRVETRLRLQPCEGA